MTSNYAPKLNKQEARKVLDGLVKALNEALKTDADGNPVSSAEIERMQSECRKNPAGFELTDEQKRFYCALPLDFRLCYSPSLLEAKARQEGIEKKIARFKICEKKTGHIFLDNPKFEHFKDVLVHIFLDRS